MPPPQVFLPNGAQNPSLIVLRTPSETGESPGGNYLPKNKEKNQRGKPPLPKLNFSPWPSYPGLGVHPLAPKRNSDVFFLGGPGMKSRNPK